MLKPRLFTPGPTPVPEETLLELAKPVTYHRTNEQKQILGEVLADLKYVYQTTNDVLCLTSSGTGGRESAASNLLAPGKTAIMLSAARRGERRRATMKGSGTGVGHDIEAFGKLVAKTPAVLVVDGISGLGAMECRTDAWHIDICVAGSQKALMMPPGLAYVSVSPKAWNAIEANTAAKNFYFD